MCPRINRKGTHFSEQCTKDAEKGVTLWQFSAIFVQKAKGVCGKNKPWLVNQHFIIAACSIVPQDYYLSLNLQDVCGNNIWEITP